MSETTKTANRRFLDMLGLVVHDIEQLSDSNRVAALTSLLTNVQAREIAKICVSMDAAELTFTDTQWAKIESRISFSLGSARAESDVDY